MNNIIAKSTIEEYKNNIDILNGLKIKFKTGTFNAYDIALYNKLVEANKEENEKRKLYKMA